MKRGGRIVGRDYLGFGARQPKGSEKPARPNHVTYYSETVANVCLNCPNAACNNYNGCSDYHAALLQTSKTMKRGQGNRQEALEIDGRKLTLNQWADVLHISKQAIWRRARKYKRTITEEITLRIEEAENGG